MKRTETFLVVGGLAVVVGGTLLWSSLGGDEGRSTTETVLMIAPPADLDADGGATAALAKPEASPNYVPVTGPAQYMVTTRLTSIHGSPSATASVLYAFPAGRRLRVAGREAGFVRIEDLQSKATGWVDESLLAPATAAAPARPPAPSTPSTAALPDADSGPAPATPKPPPKPSVAAPKPASAPKPPAPPKPQIAAETDAAAAAAKKQAAKRAQQRGAQSVDRNRGFEGFLNRAFGGR